MKSKQRYFTLARQLEIIALAIISPFGIYMSYQGDWYWGGLTLLTCIAIGVSLTLPDGKLRARAEILTTVIIPGSVVVAFMAKHPGYAVFWSFPFVLYLYIIRPVSSAAIFNFLFVVGCIRFYSQSAPLDVTMRFLAAHMVVAGFAMAFAYDRLRKEKHLRQLAITDSLSGLYNRRFILGRMQEAANLSTRYDQPSAILLVDIDNFKAINDEHGHAAGDEAITEVATMLRNRLRQSDMAARIGGDEFLLLLPHTDESSARALAESIINGLRELPLQSGARIRGSIGVACHAGDETSEQWLARCDIALYRSKEQGRDQLTVADSTQPLPV